MKHPFFTERQLLIIGSILVLMGLLLNLGVQPLFLEEPRRIMIAIEMAENGQYIAPTELGDYYYKKPPVFNWLLLLSASLFGGYTEFAFRMPTVLSTIGMGLLIWWFTKPYIGTRAAWITGLLFVISSGIFFYFSLLAEIDIFYSLVTLASFFCLFHFYQKQQYWLAFWGAYFFGAIGALTKGPPSVLFLGFTIVGYLLWKRDWKRLFSAAHLTGGFLFLTIFGGYLYAYSFHHPVPDFLKGLWGQSSEMTVLERPSILDLIVHFITFPLSTLADILPGGLLLLFAIRKGIWKYLKANELIVFAILVVVVNMPVYMISPGGRQRYIYMLYPFMLMVGVYCYERFQERKDWRWKAFRIVSGVILGVMPVAAIVLNFIPDLHFLTYLLPLSIIGFVVLAGLFWLFWKNPPLTLPLLIIGVALARIIFDLTVLPQRNHDSDALREKIRAQEILKITGDEPVYIYRKKRISFTTTVYMDIFGKQSLRRKYEAVPDVFYIVHEPSHLVRFEPDSYEVFTEISYNGEIFKLVKFNEIRQRENTKRINE